LVAAYHGAALAAQKTMQFTRHINANAVARVAGPGHCPDFAIETLALFHGFAFQAQIVVGGNVKKRR